MGKRGDHKDDYHDPAPGTNLHLILLLMRSPRGLTTPEARQLGILSGQKGVAQSLAYLRDQCGYAYAVIGVEPHEPFMRRYRTDAPRPGNCRPLYRYMITARYRWNGTVAEDYVAARLQREADRERCATSAR